MQIKTTDLDFEVTNLTHNGGPIGTGTQYPWKGPWVTATAYSVNDCIEYQGSGYVCVTAHTSGVFATDLSAGKWDLLVQKGADGTNGINGTNGTNGIDGTQYPWQGPWVTSTAYVVNDCVEYDGSGYVCIVAHTSGVFSTDFGAGKWNLLVRGQVVLTGAGAPATTPAHYGDMYIDTTGPTVYIATGTTNSGDWTAVN